MTEAPLPQKRPGEPSLPNVTRDVASTSTQSQSAKGPQARPGLEQRSATTALMNTAAPELLPFDEEAKLVYGVVFSLRNMVRKLGGE